METLILQILPGSPKGTTTKFQEQKQKCLENQNWQQNTGSVWWRIRQLSQSLQEHVFIICVHINRQALTQILQALTQSFLVLFKMNTERKLNVCLHASTAGVHCHTSSTHSCFFVPGIILEYNMIMGTVFLCHMGSVRAHTRKQILPPINRPSFVNSLTCIKIN